MSARASGEVIEILPFLASASGSPTSYQTCFFSVSSSTKVTVAPNVMVSPESFDTSMTSARASLSSSSAMRVSLCDCVSLAAWYSAFSDKSPCVRASVICWMMRGRSTCWRCLSSFSSAAYPSAVIGILSICSLNLRLQPTDNNSDRGPKHLRPRDLGPCPKPSGSRLRLSGCGLTVEIALQRAHLEVTPEISFDSLRCGDGPRKSRSEEHTSELQSLRHLVCRLL